jgi:flagellar motor switch protein FliN/FliY
MADQSAPASSPEPQPAAATPAPTEPAVTAPSPEAAAVSAAAAAATAATAAPAVDAAAPAAAESSEPAVADASAPAGVATESADAAFDQSAIDELLKQANFEDPTAMPSAAAAALPDTSNFDLPNFQQVMADAQVSSIDLLRDVELNVKIELGRSHMLVEDVLKLGEGSVVELDKLAGDPVDVFVNERLVARGEVLVLNDNFCVRVNEIVAGARDELP